MDKVTPIGSPKGRRPRKTVAKRPSTTSSDMTLSEAREKAKAAFALRLGGKRLSDIAAILDVGDKDQVTRLLKEQFSADAEYLTQQERTEMLGMELARLDALQDAVWISAMMGDPKSVDTAVRIIGQRAKLVGLEKVDPVVNKQLVLVMGDKEEDYIKALKAVSDD